MNNTSESLKQALKLEIIWRAFSIARSQMPEDVCHICFKSMVILRSLHSHFALKEHRKVR